MTNELQITLYSSLAILLFIRIHDYIKYSLLLELIIKNKLYKKQ